MRLRQEIQEMLRPQLTATAALTGGLPFAVGLAVFLFFGFCTIAMASDAWISGISIPGLVRILAAILFLAISIITAAITLSDRTRRSAEVIPPLLRRSNEQMAGEPVDFELLAHIEHMQETINASYQHADDAADPPRE